MKRNSWKANLSTTNVTSITPFRIILRQGLRLFWIHGKCLYMTSCTWHTNYNSSACEQNSLQKTFPLVAQAADLNRVCSCSIWHISKTSPPEQNDILTVKKCNRLSHIYNHIQAHKPSANIHEWSRLPSCKKHRNNLAVLKDYATCLTQVRKQKSKPKCKRRDPSSPVRNAHTSICTTLHNCGTQYSTKQSR